jgi:heme exporter protein C
MTSPAPSRPAPAPAVAAAARTGPDLLLLAAVVAVVATAVRAIWFTPLDVLQGPAQKIFYLHVPSAITALYVAFPIMAIASGVYLWLRDERADRLAASAAEVGLVFMTAVLVTGPIWAKPIWGTWWTWDARLTLTLFLWFVVLGYLVLRGAIEEPAMRARYSAVLGLLAVLLVPFIHLSVYLFRTLHPMPIVLKPERPSMPGTMLLTFALGMVAFLLLFAALLRTRYRLATERAALDALHHGEGHP